MCVLIGINQLGFGSVVPVLPLYARSFGVSQAAIGLAIAVYGLARFLVAVPGGSALRPLRPAPGARARWPRDGGRQPPLRLRAELSDLRGRPVRGRRGRGVRPHRRADRAGRHHHTGRARAGRWPSTRARSSSPSASGRFRAACWPSDSVSRPRSSPTRSWAASRPWWAGSASPRRWRSVAAIAGTPRSRSPPFHRSGRSCASSSAGSDSSW